MMTIKQSNFNKVNPISKVSNGVMLNTYPDSIGARLSDLINVLKKPEFKDVFSLFYILPTFFNSDLDRGFSIVDYNINKELVSLEDLKELQKLNILLKFDIVLNHLSVASPQFKDLLKQGDQSKFKDFFINWNTFWEDHGTMGKDGVVVPNERFLSKLFMRKSGLPILKVRFPDGSEKPYWNTFYQEIKYQKLTSDDLKSIKNLTSEEEQKICDKVNIAIDKNKYKFELLDFEKNNDKKEDIIKILEKNKTYLGQMDVNANSPLVWEFYEDTLKKLSNFGCKILRLDAFAYLHKEVGETNFFNKPGTWEYLDKIKKIAQQYNLLLLPEIHAEFGLGLHEEVAKEGYYIYDFFFPGLVIHTLETASNKALIAWVNEINVKGYNSVNMLGCHDGIPVLDLKGKNNQGIYQKGLLSDDEIDFIMNTIMERGGRVKNLYDAAGNKISYYQINATFFSALGENEQKLLLARAIQMFMPGIPQVWYLDIFAGKNDYQAADKGGSGGHKEINRTTLTLKDIEKGLSEKIVLNQLEIMRLRNTLSAFSGKLRINKTLKNKIDWIWENGQDFAQLQVNLITYTFSISYKEGLISKTLNF